jgi:hypothetical protein
MNEGWIFLEATKYRCIRGIDNNLSGQEINGWFKKQQNQKFRLNILKILPLNYLSPPLNAFPLPKIKIQPLTNLTTGPNHVS